MTKCAEPVLLFDEVSKSFKDHAVISGLSLELPSGAMVALVGPNGAGKSTLLKLACGLLHPTQGTVRLCAEEPTALPARNLASLAAYLPQSYPTDLPHSALELVLTGRRAHLGAFGMENREDIDICLSAMKELGVAHLAHRRVSTLSGGELQLVMAASALAQQTPVFLADEPTSDLDPARQADLMQVLRRRTREEGLTVLAAIHDANLAAAWFDRVVLLYEGRLVAQGAPGDVLTSEILNNIYGDAILVTTIDTHPVILPAGPNGAER